MIASLIIIQIILTANKDIEGYVSHLKQTLVHRKEITKKMMQHLRQSSLWIKI